MVRTNRRDFAERTTVIPVRFSRKQILMTIFPFCGISKCGDGITLDSMYGAGLDAAGDGSAFAADVQSPASEVV